MEQITKHFTQLTTAELQKIYQLRVTVFVVEQQCPYQEVDAADLSAYHIWLQEGEEILAYLRLPPSAGSSPSAAGRDWGAGFSPPASKPPKTSSMRTASSWRPRPTPEGSTKRPASKRSQRSFWRTASPISVCAGHCERRSERGGSA